MTFKYLIVRENNTWTCFMKCANIQEAEANIAKWNAKNDGCTYILA